MRSLYLSSPELASFDGEGDGHANANANGAGPGPGPRAGVVAGADGRFTQEDVNRMLADDRRKLVADCSTSRRCLRRRAESKNLTVREREQLAQQLEDLRKETRTKEQQLAHEKQASWRSGTKKIADERRSARSGSGGSAKALWSAT